MIDPREQAHQLIDRLPDTQLSALVGLLETDEEKQDVAEARNWLARHSGKGIPHAEAMRFPRASW
jgi:hypothetical protein